ncbi:hypothetical protein [Candidatus Palauibacter sp.]|uniref:hypothetical protein n=1 Tax=Candidatus Palauibacter sp. TaxID=3101350 RepID=UPI003B01C3D2
MDSLIIEVDEWKDFLVAASRHLRDNGSEDGTTVEVKDGEGRHARVKWEDNGSRGTLFYERLDRVELS